MARSPVFEKGNAWLTFCQIVMYPLSFLLGRRKTLGRQNVEIAGGYLLVANHISHLDPLFDSVAVRKSGRVPRFLAKASLWKVPVLGKALAGSDQIPVERTGAGAGQHALELATDALAKGRVVLIYPEGTVTRDPGHWPMKPRPGIGSLALSGDFPVIPVAHWGSHQVYASYVEGRRFKPLPRKDVYTVFGEPIDLTELRARPVDARSIRDASLLIMTVVRDMVAEIRSETPPTEFYDHKKAERLAQRAAADADKTGATIEASTDRAKTDGAATDPVAGSIGTPDRPAGAAPPPAGPGS